MQGGGYVTGESVKANTLTCVWQIMKLGPCPLNNMKPVFQNIKEFHE